MGIIDWDDATKIPYLAEWPVDKVHTVGYGEMEKIDVPTSSHSKQLKIRASVIMRGWARN